ncbi:MAG: hypothetical protein P8Y67_10365 [Alphaproteobacteria bacterium]
MHIVKRWAVLPILALVVTLSGCATATMSLSSQELRTIQIERVDVVYKPDARIKWQKVGAPYVERVKNKKVAKNEYQTFINSPEGKRYMQSVLSAELKKRVGAAIVPKFQGTRPVVLEITVKLFLMPNTVYRGFFGTTPMLAAVTRLKDASTGKELAKLDRAALGSTGSSQPQSEVVSVPLYDRHGNVIPGGPSTFYTIDVPNLSPEDPKAPKAPEERVFYTYIKNLSSWLRTNNRT